MASTYGTEPPSPIDSSGSAIIPPPADALGIYPLAPTDKTEQLLGVGSSGIGLGLLSPKAYAAVLAQSDDDAEVEFGDKVYEYVYNDPPAGASLDFLKTAVLCHEFQVTSRKTAEPGESPEEIDQAEIDLSDQCAEFCRHCLDKIEVPMHDILNALFEEACKLNGSLGELVWGYEDRGQWSGKLVLNSIDLKPRSSWRWVVNPYGRPIGILGATPKGSAVFSLEKFMILTFGARNGDPRGRSIFRKAVKWWSFRSQVLPDWFTHCKRFASPFAWAMLPPGVQDAVSRIANAESPTEKTLKTLRNILNGAVGAIGNGGSFNFAEATGKGETFELAMDYAARMEVWSVLMQVRATMEAKNSSKADSESQSDVLGNLVKSLKRWVERAVEYSIFYRAISYNFGLEVADRLTPRFDLGSGEHQDEAKLWSAFASLFNSGALEPSQLPRIDAICNLPIRTSDDVSKREQRADAASSALASDSEGKGNQDQKTDGKKDGQDGGLKKEDNPKGETQ